MRLHDAGSRQGKTKAVYPHHRLPLWPTEDAAPRFLEPIVRRQHETWHERGSTLTRRHAHITNTAAVAVVNKKTGFLASAAPSATARNEFHYFTASLANSNAARQVRNVRTIACFAFFD